MANIEEVQIKLESTIALRKLDEFEKRLLRLEQRARRTNATIADGGAGIDKTGNKLVTLGKTLVGAAVAYGAVRFAATKFQQVISTTASFEQLEARLKTLTGSIQGMESAMKLITVFAAETPFDVQQITTAFTTFNAIGIQPTKEELRGLGNFAASIGFSFFELSNAIISAGNGEVQVLKRLGIVARQEGDKIRLTFRGMTESVNRDWKSIMDWFVKIGNTDFGGGMALQMDTIVGKMSNLEDAWDLLAKALGERGVGQAMQGALAAVTSALDKMREKIEGTTLTIPIAIEDIGGLTDFDELQRRIAFLEEHYDELLARQHGLPQETLEDFRIGVTAGRAAMGPWATEAMDEATRAADEQDREAIRIALDQARSRRRLAKFHKLIQDIDAGGRGGLERLDELGFANLRQQVAAARPAAQTALDREILDRVENQIILQERLNRKKREEADLTEEQAAAIEQEKSINEELRLRRLLVEGNADAVEEARLRAKGYNDDQIAELREINRLEKERKEQAEELAKGAKLGIDYLTDKITVAGTKIDMLASKDIFGGKGIGLQDQPEPGNIFGPINLNPNRAPREGLLGDYGNIFTGQGLALPTTQGEGIFAGTDLDRETEEKTRVRDLSNETANSLADLSRSIADVAFNARDARDIISSALNLLIDYLESSYLRSETRGGGALGVASDAASLYEAGRSPQ